MEKCNCSLTSKEVNFGIIQLAIKEKLHRDSYQIYEDLVYECDTCKNGFHVVGEIFKCPKCNHMICLDCIYLYFPSCV